MNTYNDYKKDNFIIKKNSNTNFYIILINNKYIQVDEKIYKILKNNYNYVRYQHNKEVKHNVITTDNIDAFTSFYVNRFVIDNTSDILLKEVINIVVKEINKMNSKDKAISYLIFFEEYSDRQTANILNLPQTTVSYRKRKIQKLLQKKILEYCSYEDLFQQ